MASTTKLGQKKVSESVLSTGVLEDNTAYQKDENIKGFVKRSDKLFALSVSINKMILAFEVENNERIICSGQAGEQYPKAYPHEPKVQLFCVG